VTGGTHFSELANLCQALEKTTKRKEKTRLLSTFLLGLEEEEVVPAAYLVVGRVFPEADPKVLEVGWSTVSRVRRGIGQAALVREPLTILRVYRYFEEIASASGKGSRKKKEYLLAGLFNEASPLEAEYIMRILSGEMRIGVSEGMMLEAVAEAAGVSPELVRRSHMLLGDLGRVAVTALKEGKEGLRRVGVQLFKPIEPMLAEMSYDLEEVVARHGGKTAFEYKFDGARIQIHKMSRKVRIFSRRLTDVTESLPDIVELTLREVGAGEVLLEGEVVAFGADGRPLPFQDLMRRFRRVHRVDEMVRKIPLRLHLFDILYLDGRSLIDTPYKERWNILAQICRNELLASRIVTGQVSEADRFLREAMEAGHEGLMAKALDSPYTPGVRGKRWFKIKPADHLDLVIAAADWGHGRRRGWLSNYYLAALNPETERFEFVGKTFKGLTDEEFEEMTQRLLGLKVSETEYTVHVKPEVVVEVVYNEIQRSPRYWSGFALRFARITRIREDKGPREADTITRVRELYEKQFERKGRTGLQPSKKPKEP